MLYYVRSGEVSAEHEADNPKQAALAIFKEGALVGSVVRVSTEPNGDDEDLWFDSGNLAEESGLSLQDKEDVGNGRMMRLLYGTTEN